jgi:hypothetical protein
VAQRAVFVSLVPLVKTLLMEDMETAQSPDLCGILDLVKTDDATAVSLADV